MQANIPALIAAQKAMWYTLYDELVYPESVDGENYMPDINTSNWLVKERAHDYTTFNLMKNSVREYMAIESEVDMALRDGLTYIFETEEFQQLVVSYLSNPQVSYGILYGMLKWHDVKQAAYAYALQAYYSLRGNEEIARLWESAKMVWQLTKLNFLIDRGYQWSEDHQVWWKSSNAYHKDPDHYDKSNWRHDYAFETPVLTYDPEYDNTQHEYSVSQ